MDELTLAFRIDAPMQSWGVRSRFVKRDTATEPTKSGIVGLLASARGNNRSDDHAVKELAGLTMGVRVDREGLLERDFHTAQEVPNTMGTNHRTVISDRYYLADALFLVVLAGPATLLQELEEAVRRPHWPLFFGRKAFVPAAPLFEARTEQARWGTGLSEKPLEAVIEEHPWLEKGPERQQEILGLAPDRRRLRTVVDVRPDHKHAERRHDLPLSFTEGARRYGSRAVRVGQVLLTEEMVNGGTGKEGGALCS
jgi:CRISPR system Cascade subunit CasD